MSNLQNQFEVFGTMFNYLKSFENEENGQQRYIFTHPTAKDIFVVLKSFVPGEDTPYTFKIWRGDLDKTVSHWRTSTPYEPTAPELQLAIDNASGLLSPPPPSEDRPWWNVEIDHLNPEERS